MTQIKRIRKIVLSGLLITGVATLAATYFIIDYNESSIEKESRENLALLFPYPDPDNTQQVQLGQQLYAHECATCHGSNLEGEPNWRSQLQDGSLPAPPHNETGHTWHHPDDVLLQITKYGGASVAPKGFASRMPAFEGTLSNEDISATLAFIKSRWPKEVRMRQQRITTKINQAISE
ncbi:c-type cytochrome [Kiloniella antarctica]|uniref:C-type cytochrome n=1 Tax=Kiloniella antarctica TaxID=1550907 RepID=A0ABW5BHH1_9PROT